MKHKKFMIIAAILVIGVIFTSCTRSATGGPTDAVEESSELPNPVATDSQTMKDIIAGTQTAMAIPLDATEEADTADGEAADAETDTEAETTPEPEDEEETIVLPTSTAGPPPEIELTYNADYCSASSDCRIISGQMICTCILDYTKDQNFTIQVSNPYFGKGTELEFYVGQVNEYDQSKYILSGVSTYEPAGDGKNFFTAKVNIPDSLRGFDGIYVRVDTEHPDVYAETVFDNQ